jgi:hypothetical protein
MLSPRPLTAAMTLMTNAEEAPATTSRMYPSGTRNSAFNLDA